MGTWRGGKLRDREAQGVQGGREGKSSRPSARARGRHGECQLASLACMCVCVCVCVCVRVCVWVCVCVCVCVY